MKPVLVKKAYLPTIDEARGVSLDDIEALRWIPERHRKTFAQPISVSRSQKRGLGQTIPWEIDVAQQEHGVPLPGLLSEDKESINPRRDVAGTWVGPSNIGTLLEPDFTFDPRMDAGILLGTTESPHWWRTQTQGAKSPAGEGFQYGGFPKESFVEIPRPDNASPLEIAGGAFGTLTGMNQPTPEMLDFLSQFPQEQGTHRWGQKMGSPLTEQQLIEQELITPLSLEQSIVDSPFLPNKVASEPMDIAFQLLKEENEGQLFNEDLFDGLLPEGDLMHYDEMNDKQRAIIDAKMALPPHLFSEGSEMGENMNRFLFSRSMHEKIPDYYYDDELEYLQHYNDAIQPFVNNHEKTLEIMDNGYDDHPEHPHSFAMSRMHPDFKNRVSTVYRLYKASEPMDIAFQLLKEDPLHLQPSNTLARRAREELKTDMMGENSPAYQEMMERMMEMYEPQDETIPLEENLDQYAQETGKNPWRMLPGREIPNKYGGTAKVQLDPFTPIHPQQFYDWQAKNASEPMEIAMQLLKERVSPEAKRHKLEYDKKYESSPERVKYREELNRERRRRGIYGSHDHKDISHTEGGKLTLEGEHENRARHFKDKGTLREL